jgi:PKD repeat protein
MKKFILASAAFVALAFSSFGQQYRVCGATEMIEQAKIADPGYSIRLEQLEQFTQQYVQANGQQRMSGTILYTIPVVFHVIHNYGNENISKAQILDAVEIMNKSFQKLYADSVIVCSAFRPIIADVQVQFRLAQLDPNGNCTDGITRTVSSLTYAADDDVKQLVNWPSNQYFNIWVVQNIASGAAGYAYYPGINPAVDGVVMRHDYTGSIGTSNGSNYNARSLVHEAGHWLNLAHTWGSTNNPGVPANCSGSDFVSDTPTTMGVANFSCDTTQVTCNSLDNVQNYMDYASCHYMFTEGQKNRMHAALNSNDGDRNNLWTQANLMATGTNDGYVPVACTPVADFGNSVKYICAGTTVDFQDLTWAGDPTSWQWDFPGGSPGNSTSQNPSIQYNTPGVYDVTLTVSNSAGTDSYTRTSLIVVSAATGASSVPFTEDFENITFPSGSDWMATSTSGNVWTLSTVAAFSGAKAMRLLNHSGNPNGSIDEFTTPGYNFTNITNAGMTFRLAFAARSASSTDQLKVYASSNCGELWALRYTESGLALATGGIISASFTPTSSQWSLESVNLNTVSYNNRPSVRFKFEYTQNTGNNIYIDDINVTGISTVGIQDVEFLATLNVYPNPSAASTTVAFSLANASVVTAEVFDITGRMITSLINEKLESGAHEFTFGETLPNGVYFIKLTVDGGSLTQKIVFAD